MVRRRFWAISLEFCGKPSILEADDFLGAHYRKAMTPQKAICFLFHQNLLPAFSDVARKLEADANHTSRAFFRIGLDSQHHANTPHPLKPTCGPLGMMQSSAGWRMPENARELKRTFCLIAHMLSSALHVQWPLFSENLSPQPLRHRGELYVKGTGYRMLTFMSSTH